MKNIKNKKAAIFIVSAIVLIVSAFFLGKSVGSKSNLNQAGFPAGDGSQFSQNRNGGKNGQSKQFVGGNIRGVIDTITDSSLVLKNQDGSSKIVILSASTTISKSAIASIKDVVSGENVMIRGKANSDGSITAESIQIFDGQDFSFPNRKNTN